MKSRAKVHIGLAIALGAIFLFVNDGCQIALGVVIVILIMSALILYFNERFSKPAWKRLVNIANGIEVGDTAFSLGLFGLGIALLKAQRLWLGSVFLLISFFVLGWGIGKNFTRFRSTKTKS